MIGDSMETDIVAAVSMGYRTTLVHSGSTSRADLTRYAYRPDLIVDSLADLCDESIYRQAVGELNGVVTLHKPAALARATNAAVVAK